MNIYLSTTTVFIALALTACSSNKQDLPKLDYQSENKKIIQLEVPPDLNDPRNGDLYRLPNGLNNNTAVQTNHTVLAHVKNARIERSGTQRWLSISDKTPNEMWVLLRAFWLESGFTIYSEEPAAGLMETDWAENRAKLPNDGIRKIFEMVGLGGVYSTSERDKFLIRIEHNANNGVDIFFTHKGLEEIYSSQNKDTTSWQPRPNDPNLEAAFLARFMQYMGVDENTVAQQIQQQAAQNNGTQFAKREANNVIVYGEAQRNVNRIASALDRTGLTVLQFVPERGIFVVRPAASTSEVIRQANEKDAQEGFFSRLFGKKDSEKESNSAAGKQLLVALEPLADGQRIHLLNETGQPYTGEHAQKWLDNLYRELQ